METCRWEVSAQLAPLAGLLTFLALPKYTSRPQRTFGKTGGRNGVLQRTIARWLDQGNMSPSSTRCCKSSKSIPPSFRLKISGSKGGPLIGSLSQSPNRLKLSFLNLQSRAKRAHEFGSNFKGKPLQGKRAPLVSMCSNRPSEDDPLVPC